MVLVFNGQKRATPYDPVANVNPRNYFKDRLYHTSEQSRLDAVDRVLSSTSSRPNSEEAKRLRRGLKDQVELLGKFSNKERICEVLDECERICLRLAELNMSPDPGREERPFEDALYPERKREIVLRETEAGISRSIMEFSCTPTEETLGLLNALKDDLNAVRFCNISINDAKELASRLDRIVRKIRFEEEQMEKLSSIKGDIDSLFTILELSFYLKDTFGGRLTAIRDEADAALAGNQVNNAAPIEDKLAKLSAEIQRFNVFAEITRRTIEMFSDAEFRVNKLNLELLRSRLSDDDYAKVTTMLSYADESVSSNQIILTDDRLLIITADKGHLYYMTGDIFAKRVHETEYIIFVKNSGGNSQEAISFTSVSAGQENSTNWLIARYDSYVQKADDLLCAYSRTNMLRQVEVVNGIPNVGINGGNYLPVNQTATWIHLLAKGLEHAKLQCDGRTENEKLARSLLQLDLTHVIFGNRHATLRDLLSFSEITENSILAKLAYGSNTWLALLEIYNAQVRPHSSGPYEVDELTDRANRNVLRELVARDCFRSDLTLNESDESRIRDIALGILEERLMSKFGRLPEQLRFRELRLEL